jgi:hypothetical protein
LPRGRKKKYYSVTKLTKAKCFAELSRDIGIRLDKGSGQRYTFRYVNNSIWTDILKQEGKPCGYITLAKPDEALEGNCDGAWLVKIFESDNEWGPLLFEIALEWATRMGGGLTADRFRVTEYEYNVWDHILGKIGGDFSYKPITHCFNKSSKVWAERLKLTEDEVATSFVYKKKEDILSQLEKQKRIKIK